jgi:hypothetical protein
MGLSYQTDKPATAAWRSSMSVEPKTADGASPEVMPPAIAAAGRIHGALDMLRPDRIGGWAIDRDNRGAALEVDVFREGRRVATLRADRPRKDLARGEDGSGNHGFAVALDPPLEPGFEFTVTAVARASDGASSELRRAGAGGAATPEQRILERLFGEVRQLRQEPRDAAGLAETLQRLEITQARIEATLAAIEVPAPQPQSGLTLIVAVALATGLGSLGLGLYSMWAP